MGSVALMSGLGAGMSALGQGIDKQFQYAMEQQRLKSLEELETRKLNIMESGQKAENKWREGTLTAAKSEAYDKAKTGFQERMDKIAEQIVTNLPDQATAAMTAQLLKGVMKDESLMQNYLDPDTGQVDFEALGLAVSEAAQGMNIPGVLTDEKAYAQITRFAGAMVKEWGDIRTRFPEYARELNAQDIIDQIPAFYGNVQSETEKTVQNLHRQAKDYEQPSPDTPLMGDPTAQEAAQAPNRGNAASRIAEAGGLMSSGGLRQLGSEMYDPYFDAATKGKWGGVPVVGPYVEAFKNIKAPGVPEDHWLNRPVSEVYRKAENAFSRFMFGDQLGGMTRGPDGMLHYPDPQSGEFSSVTIDPNVKDDYSFR